MVNIREFSEQTDQDYEAGVAIWNANWPDYLETVEEWKAWHATRNPEDFFQRLIGEINGQAACYADWGESGWANYPGKHNWDFHVHPDHDFNMIAPQMYDHMMAKIMERKPTKISSGTHSDKTERIAFMEAQGYKLSQTEPTSLLDVTAFDPSAFQKAVDRADEAGINICSCAQLKKIDPHWKQKLYELRWEIAQDVPSTDPPKKQPFEVFAKQQDDPIAVNLSTRYVAVDTTKATEGDIGAYVAVSNLDYNRVNKVKGHTGLTGVARAYRRKGIATAIKVHALSQAKADGIEIIDTDNDENNPMLDLNIQLGFKPGPSWLDYELIIA
ncbi:GNAT family N-acetyltransferase [Chloroflexi bacterium TSY]|nr:GNAT family N-acetyltransferase [Chloroflexi bacterium TSY]